MQVEPWILVLIAFLFLVTVALLVWTLTRQSLSSGVSQLDMRAIDQSFNSHINSAVGRLRSEMASEREQAIKETRLQLETISSSQQQAVLASLNKDKHLIEAGLSSVRNSNSQSLETLASQIQGRFKEVGEAIKLLQTKSAQQFGDVTSALEGQKQSTEALNQVTRDLDKILGASSTRGALGERFVEEIFRSAGMVEGIHYEQQAQIEGTSSRPDFMINLPSSQVVYMDVKFPFDAYVRIQHAQDGTARKAAEKEFAKAVKDHINTLAKREYGAKGGSNVLNHVIMFLPNESIAGCVFEADRQLINLALDKNIVVLSPMTLFAYLGVIRQATDRYALQSASLEVFTLVSKFEAEFTKYCEQVETVQRQFLTVSRSFDVLAGTRRNTLVKPIEQIRDLRQRSLDCGNRLSSEEEDRLSGDEIGASTSGGQEIGVSTSGGQQDVKSFNSEVGCVEVETPPEVIETQSSSHQGLNNPRTALNTVSSDGGVDGAASVESTPFRKEVFG